MGTINGADIFDTNRPPITSALINSRTRLARCSVVQKHPTDAVKNRAAAISDVIRRPWARAVGLKANRAKAMIPPRAPKRRRAQT